jgi:hypothetical protein
MLKRAFAVILLSIFGFASPALAADGQIVITHAKALAGGVTAGDAPGYPVTLNTSGSYILGSNLFPGKDRDGIVAAIHDVSIDLNGFTISGGSAGGGPNNARYGIFDQGDRLTVKNGTIGAFKKAGIFAANRPYLIVENMRIIDGAGWGINAVSGAVARIQNNTVSTNTTGGIVCGRSCHIEGNVVSLNGVGIRAIFATVLGNTITFNSGYAVQAGATSDQAIGFGNNTILSNNGGGSPTYGSVEELHPNFCDPPC